MTQPQVLGAVLGHTHHVDQFLRQIREHCELELIRGPCAIHARPSVCLRVGMTAWAGGLQTDTQAQIRPLQSCLHLSISNWRKEVVQ